MLKIYEDQTVSLYRIQKDMGLSQRRLYKYATGEHRIENMPGILMLKLARYFNIKTEVLKDLMLDYQNNREV